MDKTNALKLRQSLGKVLNQLKKNKGPILVEQNSKPAAVLISIEEYKKRFVDYDADEKRKELVSKLKIIDASVAIKWFVQEPKGFEVAQNVLKQVEKK